MALRRSHALAFALVIVFATTGASVRTPNFVVHAPTRRSPRRSASSPSNTAARRPCVWLGQEMPHLGAAVPAARDGQPGGAERGDVVHASGRAASPARRWRSRGRWSGCSTACCRTRSRTRCSRTTSAGRCRAGPTRAARCCRRTTWSATAHDKLVRQILNRGGQFPLRTLFTIEQYPKDHEASCACTPRASRCRTTWCTSATGGRSWASWPRAWPGTGTGRARSITGCGAWRSWRRRG